jgi:CTP:molybdopterin cytidylyltransferase MocA
MISGIVLAAGEGRRFGGTKQLVELRDKPLAQHAVDALESAGVDEIIVVSGHDAEAVERGIVVPAIGRFVRNERFREGQASSLAAALREIDDQSEGAVVLMADQPGVTGDDVRALIEGFRATRGAIVRLSYADGPGPALLSREIFAEAAHLHGDVGARVLMASHPEWVVEVAIDRAAPFDVDVLDDLPG